MDRINVIEDSLYFGQGPSSGGTEHLGRKESSGKPFPVQFLPVALHKTKETDALRAARLSGGKMVLVQLPENSCRKCRWITWGADLKATY
jgi:hypothetical protein